MAGGDTPCKRVSVEDPLEQLARRVAPLVAGSIGDGIRLLDASEVAKRCGVTRGWVYEHAAELGALRLGNGRRPRLRFDPRVVDEVLRDGIGHPHPRKRRALRNKTVT